MLMDSRRLAANVPNRVDEHSDDFYTPIPSNGTFPMHLRREFVLTNGDHVILGSTDLEMDIIDQMIATANGPEYIVRELFGQDKSEPLRPILEGSRSFVA